jgi:long-subunit acyl-CoA synthetase (AMP-forming)
LTLIYTSGTTGDPKGVEITHDNALAEAGLIHGCGGVYRGDRYTSYLPSAHIADRMSAHYLQMIFGTELTTVSDARTIAAVLAQVRPHIWFSVPRVWEKIKAAVEAQLASAQGAAAETINRAMELAYRRVRAQQAGLELSQAEQEELGRLDAAVLAPIRARLGFAELRWAWSGAAPIAPQTLEFFMALGVPISEIWGMSEVTGLATGSPLDRVKLGSVGVVLPGVELRVEEDGEALVRGPIVMRGYRNDPDRTAEVLSEDGWLRTGDVVTVDEDGYVTIVDRKKELIINAGGKNMSPSNIENTVKAYCPLVGMAVAIGDARPYNTALLVLDSDVAAAFAAKAGLADATAAALAAHPAVVGAIAQGVAEGNAKLSRVEQVKRFRILPVFWEPGGDEITATMKLRRKPIGQKYATEIESLYADDPGPDVHEPTAVADPV